MTKPDLTKYSHQRLVDYHEFACQQALDFAHCTQNGRMAWRRERDRVEAEVNRRYQQTREER